MLTKTSLAILFFGSICILTQSLSIPETEEDVKLDVAKDANSEEVKDLKAAELFDAVDFKHIFASPPIVSESAFEGRLLNVSKRTVNRLYSNIKLLISMQNVTSDQSNAIILFGALAIGLGLVLATQIDSTQGVAARITDNMSQAEDEVSEAR